MSGREYRFEFRVSAEGNMNIPVKLRERYWVGDSDPQVAIVQPIGRWLLVTIWSPKDCIEIKLPLAEWHAKSPEPRSLTGDRINIDRWTGMLAIVESNDDDELDRLFGRVESVDPDWSPVI